MHSVPGAAAMRRINSAALIHQCRGSIGNAALHRHQGKPLGAGTTQFV
jgi:hypothetical protein